MATTSGVASSFIIAHDDMATHAECDAQFSGYPRGSHPLGVHRWSRIAESGAICCFGESLFQYRSFHENLTLDEFGLDRVASWL